MAGEMANTHLPPELASEEICALDGNVWLDDSLQGWTSVSLAKAAHDRKLKINEDSPDLIGNQAQNGIIALGYYRSAPREIVLFRRAIQLVAELPEFSNAGIDASLLFKSVLFHEIGHWLTLIPSLHNSRIQRIGKSFPSEEAESLTELLNWLFLSQSTAVGDAESRRLLQFQYFKRNCGPVWQYQVYPFWLVATGLVTSQAQLEGLEPGRLSVEAHDYLTDWFRGCSEEPARGAAARNVSNSSFPTTADFHHLLPGFEKSCFNLYERIRQLTKSWPNGEIVDSSKDHGGTDLFDVLDI
jgi:hypothetical protein